MKEEKKEYARRPEYTAQSPRIEYLTKQIGSADYKIRTEPLRRGNEIVYN